MLEPTELGLAPPSQPVTGVGAGVSGQLPPRPTATSVGGIMNIQSLSQMQAAEDYQAAIERAAQAQNEPVMQSLAGHIRAVWQANRQAKQRVEQEMLAAVRAKRGEYDPEKLNEIRKQGGSEIYMMIFATKARQAKALMADVLIGTGSEKPWTIKPSPKPDLPPSEVNAIMQALYEEVYMMEMQGLPMTQGDVRQKMADAKEALESRVLEDARRYAERAEAHIEDIMVEGGWLEAFDEFLDDLTVFPTAFLKGPIVRKEPRLCWSTDPETGKNTPIVENKIVLEYARVDPFKMYPSKDAKHVNDGNLIELHALTRSNLDLMRGVEGYSEDAIKAVLDAHGSGGLREWLNSDSAIAHAEGRDLSAPAPYSETIDAIQFWGSASGKMLKEWGMSEEEVPDEAKEYEIEAWMVGSWVIKAIINPDPLHRRNYFADGFSRVPGAFWHSSLYTLVRDVQDMANGAARALSNNMGMASGPQVGINIDRLAQGEEITQMYPWRQIQFTSDPMGSSAAPIVFFQPESHAQELMAVFDKFSMLADEYSGVPRYMTGLSGGEGGAGRTASGMSMMIGNASKQIKQLVSSIDLHVIGPSVKLTYDHEMQHGDNEDMKGDLQVVARGALSLITKESAQVRRNEFLMTTANPFDLEIIGMEGRAEVLREVTKGLNMETSRIVPSRSQIKMKQLLMAQAQSMQQQNPQGPQGPEGNGQELTNSAPVTDNFSPQAQ